MISVRSVRPVDGEALEELRQEARAEAAGKRGGPELLADVAHTADDAPDVTIVALIGQASVGVASARARSGALNVTELFVTPAARGVGVGAALLSSLVDRAGDLECSRVEAVALPGDRDTKNFFESHGLTARRIIVGRTIEP